MNIKLKFAFKPVRGTKRLENLADFRNLVTMGLLDAVSKTMLRNIQTRFNKAKGAISRIEEYPQLATDTTEKQARKLEMVRDALDSANTERVSAFNQVMSLLTNREYIQLLEDSDSITVGVGYLPLLDEIKAPSATPILHNKNSRSPYNILWRQMEFGMGVLMRKPYPLPIAQTRSSSSAGWWYGPKTPKAGIHFKGTAPGNILRDRTGLPYSQDALQFHSLFAREFRRILRG